MRWSTQPCVPHGSLNRVPVLTGWGKGGNDNCAGWQETLVQSGGRRHLEFSNLWNFIDRQSLEGTKSVVKIGRLVVDILQFFEFSKWPLPPSWLFWNSEILLAIGAESVEMHHCAKFRQNQFFVVEILQFFKFSKWPPPPSCIFEIVKFYWLLW